MNKIKREIYLESLKDDQSREEDEFLYKEMVLESLRTKQQMDRRIDMMPNLDTKVKFIEDQIKNLTDSAHSKF